MARARAPAGGATVPASHPTLAKTAYVGGSFIHSGVESIVISTTTTIINPNNNIASEMTFKKLVAAGISSEMADTLLSETISKYKYKLLTGTSG